MARSYWIYCYIYAHNCVGLWHGDICGEFLSVSGYRGRLRRVLDAVKRLSTTINDIFGHQPAIPLKIGR